ncbi:MAG: hypothetical protein K2P99_00685, partial [Burkholderiales bacterium]|nr:hypothetical protein [Burkholderiales bacterium]
MIIVILLTLLNSLALGLIIKLALLAFKLKVAFWVIMCGCLGMFWFISVLAYTNLISNLMILLAHLRVPLVGEAQRLNSLLKTVISRIYSKPNNTFQKLDNLKFIIINSQILEDYVIGKNIIAISN